MLHLSQFCVLLKMKALQRSEEESLPQYNSTFYPSLNVLIVFLCHFVWKISPPFSLLSVSKTFDVKCCQWF